MLRSMDTKDPQRLRSIVVLTGASISAESGIRTFRAADGLWENHRVESPPQRRLTATRRWYTAFIMPAANNCWGYRPMAQSFPTGPTGLWPSLSTASAKTATTALPLSHKISIICMNVLAANRYCTCTASFSKAVAMLLANALTALKICTRTHCVSVVGSPIACAHIVWFGEMPLYMDEIEQALRHCDLFISIGTSGHVYPAAGFFQMAKAHGAHTVELNIEPSANGSEFDEAHYGPATDVVEEFVSTLL